MEFTNGDTDIHPHTNATLVPTSSDESHTHTHTHAHIHTITYTHTCWWVSECKTHNSIKDVSVNQAVLLIAYFAFFDWTKNVKLLQIEAEQKLMQSD